MVLSENNPQVPLSIARCLQFSTVSKKIRKTIDLSGFHVSVKDPYIDNTFIT